MTKRGAIYGAIIAVALLTLVAAVMISGGNDRIIKATEVFVYDSESGDQIGHREFTTPIDITFSQHTATVGTAEVQTYTVVAKTPNGEFLATDGIGAHVILSFTANVNGVFFVIRTPEVFVAYKIGVESEQKK